METGASWSTLPIEIRWAVIDRADPAAGLACSSLNRDCRGLIQGSRWALLRQWSKDRVAEALKRPSEHLIQFAREGKIRLVELMLFHRADVNATDINGFTPLHWAADEGFLPVCRTLVEGGANIDQEANFGATPLFCAQVAQQTHVADFLMAQKAQ